MRKFLLPMAILALSAVLMAQQSLNNEAIIKLAKAGLSDDLIISTINTQPGTFDTSTDGLISLKAGGVSDKVVAAIEVKAAAAAPPPGPAAGAATSPATQGPIGPDAPVAQQTGKPAEAPPVPVAESPTQEGSQPAERNKYRGQIQPGSRIVIAPMGGFETYFAAAIREKGVPITLTLDRDSAQYFIVSTETEWRGFVAGSAATANWNQAGGNYTGASSASSTRGLESSIMLIDAKSKDVVWAYEVHKSSHGALIFGTLAARGQQSLAEACAKHLKEFMEKGK